VKASAGAGAVALVLDLSQPSRDKIAILEPRGVPIWTDLHDFDGRTSFHQPFLHAATFVFMNADRISAPLDFLRRAVHGRAQVAVCTLGALGAIAVDDDLRVHEVPAAPIGEVVDFNGAGDGFTAGLMAAHLDGADIRAAGERRCRPSRASPVHRPTQPARPVWRAHVPPRERKAIDMSTTTPTATLGTEAAVVPSTTHRRVAAVAGVMYLLTIFASVPAQYFNYAPVLANARYVLGAGADTRVLWGGLLELITALACIGTAVVLFPVVRRQHEGAALGFVTARVLEAVLIVTGIVSMLSVVTLRQPDAAGAEAAARVVASEALVAVHDGTFLLGPGVMPGVNALLLGYLMYRSRLVPRLIPVIGLAGAPLFLVAGAATLVGVNEPASIWTVLATLPIFVWEFSLGVWLLVKGFRPSGVTSEPKG
jgi:hypothetical protein